MAREHTLYLVATPIGNLDDISQRAVTTLRDVVTIYAEDTRHSRRLLQAHGISTPVHTLHEHNEAERADEIARRIAESGSAALISDAGTPLISDPGYRLVKACVSMGVTVSPVPGACALIAAISASGLPTDRFSYAGFPPARGAVRAAWFAEHARSAHTVVFYESPHRILDAVEQIVAHSGAGHPLVLGREITKRFETFLRGTAAEVLEQLRADANQQRGEFVVVLGAATRALDEHLIESSVDAVIGTLTPHLPPKTVARILADLGSISRRDAYARVLALRGEQDESAGLP